MSAAARDRRQDNAKAQGRKVAKVAKVAKVNSGGCSSNLIDHSPRDGIVFDDLSSDIDE